MLTLLRKIRRSVIDSATTKKLSSPFLRYSVYAIGEIVLVVIGILIALQINNWNIDRINRIQEKSYLKRIVKDLESDLFDLSVAIRSNDDRLLRGVWLLESLERDIDEIKSRESYLKAKANLPNFDQFEGKSFGKVLTDFRMFNTFNENVNTFQEIIANGKSDIIRDEELKITIQSHYSSILEKKWLQNIVEKERDTYIEYLVSNGISNLNTFSVEEILSRINNKEVFYAQIENYLLIASEVQKGLRDDEDSIENTTEILIKRIKAYLADKY